MSLLDVLERYSFGFYEVILSAQQLHCEVTAYGELESFFAGLRDAFPAFLDKMNTACVDLGLTHTRGLVAHAGSRLEAKGTKYTHLELLSDLEALIFSFGSELRREVFVRIPRDKEPLFQADALFGAEVDAAFPSAADDIKNAGTSQAVGLADASVFHSMRVLERGLGVIAAEVGVAFDRKNWATIIDGIESAMKKNAAAPGVDPKRRRVMAEAAVHLRFVKDAWRNDVMHAGDVYDAGRAQSILDHVREFMRALADAGLAEPSS